MKKLLSFLLTLTISMSMFSGLIVFSSPEANAVNIEANKTGAVTNIHNTGSIEISNAIVVSSTDTSYTIQCNVSPDVTTCRFPTWWAPNRDYVIWHEGTVANGIATCTIPLSSYFNLEGQYITHIYAYDAFGNYAAVEFSTTFHIPEGSFDGVLDNDGTLHLVGWAIDRDAINEPLEVHAYLGGEAGNPFAEFHSFYADQHRADVDAALGVGAYHGFDTHIKTNRTGFVDVYVYFINKGNGSNIFCEKKTVYIAPDTVPPTASNVKVVPTTATEFTVSCDVSDNRTAAFVNFEVWTEENPANKKTVTASVFNNTAGCNFSISDFNNYAGTYYVNAVAVDTSWNTSITSATVRFYPPQGSFNAVVTENGEIKISGWALDKDTPDEAVDVYIYVGGNKGELGVLSYTLTADGASPEIEDMGCGTNHGFKGILQTKDAGAQAVYVYAQNKGIGVDSLIGTTMLDIPEDIVSPVISELKVESTDIKGLTLSCNVTDNRVMEKVIFEVWSEENPGKKIATESIVENGIAKCKISVADFNNYQGAYYAAVTAIDKAENKTTRQIITTFNLPIGTFEITEPQKGIFRIDGWALDKDITSQALKVYVYVGGDKDSGIKPVILDADLPRKDIPNSGWGKNHGFDGAVRTDKHGEQKVYIYIQNYDDKELVLLSETTVNMPDYIYGDADGSGDVTISDVTYIQKILAGIEEEGENTLFLADVNRNGEIDIRDATNIQLFLTKNIDFLPVKEST